MEAQNGLGNLAGSGTQPTTEETMSPKDVYLDVTVKLCQ